MAAYDLFVSEVHRQMGLVETTQRAAIETAATWVGEALRSERFFWAFGTGHSHMLAEEIFYRAGGLAKAAPILEGKLMLHDNAIEATYLERESGYAQRILDQYPLAAGDVLLVASNGGRNAVPVEMVLEARQRGVRTVALTNLNQSRNWPSRHSSGKRLFEVADLVIDNCGVDGDAAVNLPGFDLRIGPPSSITGMLIMNLIVVQAIENCLKVGAQPEVFISSNTRGDDHNDVLLKKYRSHIRHL